MRLPPVECLDDVRAILADFPARNDDTARIAAAREPQLTKPEGSLGRLEDIAKWLSAWQGKHPPTLKKPAALIFAGNHGIAERGVSAYPSEVTAQMVTNFVAGGAAINQLCRAFEIDLRISEMALEEPTQDFLEAPAMEDDECAGAIAFGMSAVNGKTDLLILGEMGIGNTTAAAAICRALFGGTTADWVGPGTGVEGEALDRKVAVVAEGITRHEAALTDGLEVLRHFGGREMAAIAGAVIGARLRHIPVMLDGYVCCAAAAPLQTVHPGALDHCMVGHVSAEPAHEKLLGMIGHKGLLNLDMRLGEGSGAAVAVGLVKAAVACHTGMATFHEAGVTAKSDHVVHRD
ncbi:MAG: nicotinate-nucleotide--dimethylbenzimidazole phosphoribosyltransferase [Magnetospiraceae bacterium]